MTVKCPKCLALPGEPCVYVNDKLLPRHDTGWYAPRVNIRPAGTPIPGKMHYERNDEFFRLQSRTPIDQVLALYEARRKRKAEAWAALREFDRREYEALRDWLRDWGYLLTEANLPHRPDGTLRGETYLFGNQ